ncbi:hypothetical protein [Metaclostridioides mangenotii]|uniref:hypothetical protein n=1 Tax=Metaclostridioides mangenotii TaxID=1540 RepID=UPI0028E8BFA4|nr:hypothetical protein [Clostridioides mangenotii]
MSKKKSKKIRKNKQNYRNNVLNKKEVKEKQVDPLTIIIARSHIVVAVILLVCAALTFTNIIPFSIIATVMLLSLVFQQLLVGYGSYKQKNYYKLVYSIAIVVLIVIGYLIVIGKIDISSIGDLLNMSKK